MRELCRAQCHVPDDDEWERSGSLLCGLKTNDVVESCIEGNYLQIDGIYVFIELWFIMIWLYDLTKGNFLLEYYKNAGARAIEDLSGGGDDMDTTALFYNIPGNELFILLIIQ